MKTLMFYGVSDDLFKMDRDLSEEISCYNQPGIYQLKSSTGEMMVYGHYTHTGT